MTLSPLLLGIDLGTSSVKTAVVDPDGWLLAVAAQEVSIETPRPGWAEQDPETWVAAALNTTRTALASAACRPGQVAAIGLSGQMHGTVCLDGRGRVIRPAIIWADQRSAAQVTWLYETLGRRRLGQWTANPLDAGFMLPTWLWLREHEPDIARATARLLLPKDFLRYRLTGEVGSEPSDASSTLLFDPARRAWSDHLLRALDVDPDLLPAIGESAQVAGQLLPSMAAAMGLEAGIPIVHGGGDQACQALGNGIVDPGVVSCTIGTGGQLFAPALAPTYDPDLRLHCFCHVLPDRWHLMAAILAAGLSLRWLRDQVLPGSSYGQLADQATAIAAGAEGLFFLPHLAGERTPHMDPHARASFIGLTLRHGRGHLVRAVMEGVVFALRQGLELMAALGVPVERIVASGGGSDHPLWLQLQADIFNCPLYRTTTGEAAAVGAALLAGIGVGIYADAREACRRAVRWHDKVVAPDAANVERYAAAYTIYRQLYPALEDCVTGAAGSCGRGRKRPLGQEMA